MLLLILSKGDFFVDEIADLSVNSWPPVNTIMVSQRILQNQVEEKLSYGGSTLILKTTNINLHVES